MVKRLGLVLHESTIHDVAGSGDVRSVVGRQEHGESSDFTGLSGSLHGDALDLLCQDGRVVDRCLVEWCEDHSRGDVVDRDACFCDLERKGPSEVAQCAFGTVVVSCTGRRNLFVDGGDVDDRPGRPCPAVRS